MSGRIRVVAVSAGESPQSKTLALVSGVVEELGGETIDLSQLSAEGLLGRKEDPAVAAAVDKAVGAQVLIVATPVYRATYTGALKAFFDRFQPGALRDTVVVLAATAAVPEHFLALDTSGRALVASVGGWTAPTVVYATGDDFIDGLPTPEIVDALKTALQEAVRIAPNV